MKKNQRDLCLEVYILINISLDLLSCIIWILIFIAWCMVIKLIIIYYFFKLFVSIITWSRIYFLFGFLFINLLCFNENSDVKNLDFSMSKQISESNHYLIENKKIWIFQLITDGCITESEYMTCFSYFL